MKKLKQFCFDLFNEIEAAKYELNLLEFVLSHDMYNSIYKLSLQVLKHNRKEDSTYNAGECIYYISGENKGLFKGCEYNLIEIALIITLEKFYYVRLEDIENYLKTRKN